MQLDGTNVGSAQHLPGWTLPVFDLSLVHPSARSLSTPMRAFKDFVGDVVPRLFPDLPT